MVNRAMDVADDLVLRKVCRKLQQFNVRNLDLTAETDITGDLEIDSVAVLDLIMEVEDEYGISFPMNLLSEIRTVGDLVRAIHKQAGAQ
jgi:acyl carrier protein